ncbi:rhodanese family protein [Achromobacter anxifer]|uniref:rhodanese family protein n=1 Tax=Achromobacter anxifer TaxID=1287737 RepID=UPI0023F7CA61|nr:rhodanese family protein [Achromobacter anxifer]MDF8361286.1 rhodanese family protein [Achromobacter anxifer]
MSLKLISPQEARDLLSHGAVLIDIRGTDEHAREHISVARHMPMEHLKDAAPLDAVGGVIFHCRSGNRTQINAQALSAYAACDVYGLAGGLDAWKKAGLPVVVDASQPMELQRQVQITAGTLIVMGTALGATASLWFLVLPGFIGAGLVFAGVSGFCGMARLLMRMPWNRRAVGR